MLVKGCSSLAQLQQISIFQDLAIAQLENLVRCSHVKEYQPDEIVMHEGDAIPQQLHALITGKLEIKNTADNGKETIVRLILPSKLFAVPAIFGNGTSSATINM